MAQDKTKERVHHRRSLAIQVSCGVEIIGSKHVDCVNITSGRRALNTFLNP